MICVMTDYEKIIEKLDDRFVNVNIAGPGFINLSFNEEKLKRYKRFEHIILEDINIARVLKLKMIMMLVEYL